MSSRDDIAASMERIDRAKQRDVTKPGLQRPSMDLRAPKPPEVKRVPNSVPPKHHLAEGPPPRKLDSDPPEVVAFMQRHPTERARHVAEYLHQNGLHVDHPDARIYVQSAEVDPEHVRRLHAAVERRAASVRAINETTRRAAASPRPAPYLQGK